MRLYFIRHAQSENNALFETSGSDYGRVDDPRLTEVGLRQAELTSKYLSSTPDPVDRYTGGGNFGITHLYCSPMYRAIATGKCIAEALHLPLVVLKDWHETGGIFLEDKKNGTFTIRPGMTRSEMLQVYPKVDVRYVSSDGGWWNRPFEVDDERPVRARRAFQTLLEMHPREDDRVAIISHGGFYNHFMAAAMGLEVIRPLWFDLYNCGITRFKFNPGDQSVIYHNFTSHLGNGLIT